LFKNKPKNLTRSEDSFVGLSK